MRFAAAMAGLGATWSLAQSHIAVSAAGVHLAVTAGSALLILIVCERLLAGRAGLASSQGRALAVCVALAFGVRYGGMALPQSVIIDMPWHMKWLRTLLAGDWQSLYFPGGLSSVPREWGLDLLVPKSPLFYFAAAPLGWLPFDFETSAKWLICLLDSTLVLAAFSVGWELTGGHPGSMAQVLLIAALAVAMGIQSAAVRQLGGMSTTYLTGTLTAVITELATRDRKPGLVRSLGVLAAIVSGAIAGGLVAGHAPAWLPAVILTPLAVVVIASIAGFEAPELHPEPRRGR